MTESLLRVENLHVSYRGVDAVHDLSLHVPQDACIALIGANGAGKTSTLRGISGLETTARQCRIWLGDDRIDQLSPEKRIRLGLGHVLEGRHIFPNLTVRENLELGTSASRRTNRFQKTHIDEVLELFPELDDMLSRPGGRLSGGQQQLLAVARALMGSPTVLLLDEPTVGLAPQLLVRIKEVILQTVKLGTPVLLVEQVLEIVSAVASVVHLLSHGKIVGTTTGDDPDLAAKAQDVYLR